MHSNTPHTNVSLHPAAREPRTRVRREAPSQRRHYRLTAPIWIRFTRKTVRTTNWSRGGFAVANVDTHTFSIDKFPVRVLISFQGYEIGFNTNARLVWTNAQARSAAFEFLNLNDKQNELLDMFARGLINGQMASIEDTIKRIDIPVTPIQEEPDRPFEDDVDIARKRLRRIGIGAAYLAGGLLVGSYIASSVYSSIFEITVETAVVGAPVEVLRAPASGMLDRLYVPVDGTIRASEPILSIQDTHTLEELELAKIAAQIERAALKEKESALRTVRDIGSNRVDVARAKLKTLEEQLALAEKIATRMQRLRKSGVITELDLEQAMNKAAMLRSEITAAKADVRIATRGIGNINDGRMFASLELKGDMPELDLAVSYARQRVALEEQKLKVLQQRLDNSRVFAPFDGRVTRYFSSAGTVIEKGQPLAVIQHANLRHIEAFLSQTEIDRMSLTKKAIAQIPSLDLEFEAAISRVDRTSGLVDQNRAQLLWPDNDARTALVVLEYTDQRGAGAEPLPTGLPVIVILKKNLSFNWLR